MNTNGIRSYRWTALVPVVAGSNRFSVVATDAWDVFTETAVTQTVDVAIVYPFAVDI